MPNNSLQKFCDVRRIELMILFGSRACATNAEYSDFDIAVKIEKGASEPDVLTLIVDLEQFFRGVVDLTNITATTDALLLHEIAAGKLLYEKESDLFCEFRARAWKEFVDAQWLRERTRRWLTQYT